MSPNVEVECKLIQMEKQSVKDGIIALFSLGLGMARSYPFHYETQDDE